MTANSVKFTAILFLLGCGAVTGHLLDKHSTSVHEGLSHQEFVELFGDRVPLPATATSINVYSHSTIDTWDLRVLFELPPADAWALVDLLRTENADVIDAEVNQVLDELAQATGPLRISGWPDSGDAPSWWQSVNTKDYEVVALELSPDSSRLWLYNAKLQRFAIWQYNVLLPDRAASKRLSP